VLERHAVHLRSLLDVAAAATGAAVLCQDARQSPERILAGVLAEVDRLRRIGQVRACSSRS
jgi:hypothetical protein